MDSSASSSHIVSETLATDMLSAIATASFKTASPSTIMKSNSVTLSCLKIDIVATGSIADMKHPNCRLWISENEKSV